MSYEELITQNKREADYEKLQQDLTKVETFIDKCLKFICESTSCVAERDFNVTSL